MSKEWFYSEGNVRKGPIGEAELRQMYTRGDLRPGDLVWTEGMDNWVEARTVQALTALPAMDSRREREEEVRERRPAEDVDDVDRPRRRSRPRREELDDDEDDRPRVRRQFDDEDDYDRPRRTKNAKPSQVQVVGILLLVGGILGLLTVLGITLGSAFFCCLWPVTYLELVWGILAIIRGVNMINQDDQGPPNTLLILQIVCILNGDIINCILGIVGLVMLGDAQVKEYYRRKGFY